MDDSLDTGSTPVGSTKKYCRKGYIFCSIFLSKSQTWYIISPFGLDIISPVASISSPKVYSLRLDGIQNFVLVIYRNKLRMIYKAEALILMLECGIIHQRGDIVSKNYLLIYSEQLATDIELLCQKIKASSNTLFQIRKSSSSVYANIREANYGQSKADMLSKFEIALKECSETEGWLQLLFNTSGIDEETYKSHRNLCGRIRRMLISSCKTLKEQR